MAETRQGGCLSGRASTGPQLARIITPAKRYLNTQPVKPGYLLHIKLTKVNHVILKAALSRQAPKIFGVTDQA